MRSSLAILAAIAVAAMAAPIASAEAGSSARQPSTALVTTNPGALGVPARTAGAKSKQLKSLQRALKAAKARPGAKTLTTLRTFAATAEGSTDAAAPSEPPQSSAAACTSWYQTSYVGLVWWTSYTWWEFYCGHSGFYGGHLADWYDFYFWNGSSQQYYATWTRYHADGCWYFWNATNLSRSGPHFC